MTKVVDGHEAQYATQEAVFAEEGKRYCEVCGIELDGDDAYLCKEHEARR